MIKFWTTTKDRIVFRTKELIRFLFSKLTYEGKKCIQWDIMTIRQYHSFFVSKIVRFGEKLKKTHSSLVFFNL